jgi:O-antigen ligase
MHLPKVSFKSFFIKKFIFLEIFVLFFFNFFIDPEILFIYLALRIMAWFFLRNSVFKTQKSSFISIIFMIVLLGSFLSLIHHDQYIMRDILRDFFYSVNPILYFLYGRMFFLSTQELKGINFFLYLIIIYTFFQGVVLLYTADYNQNLFSGSFQYHFISVDFNFIISIILLLKNKDTKLFSSLVSLLLIILFLVLIILSGSRTLLVGILLSFLVIANYSMLERINLSIHLPLILGFVLFYFLQNMSIITQITDLISRSLIEISFNNDWSVHNNVVSYWRGYEVYRVFQEFESSSIFNYLFGFGFGKNVFVGELSFLVGVDGGYIPITHNGFANSFLKTGILGVFLHFFLYLKMFLIIIKTRLTANNLYIKSLLLVAIIYMFSSTFYVNGIFSLKPYFFSLILLGYFSHKFKI